MTDRIYITTSDARDLRALVDQHSGGRDGGAAARLAAELDRAHVLEPQQLPSDVVALLSRVKFENLRTGATREVVVVRPADATRPCPLSSRDHLAVRAAASACRSCSSVKGLLSLTTAPTSAARTSSSRLPTDIHARGE